MAIRQYTVTLGAAAVQYDSTATAAVLHVYYLRIENEASNALVKYGTGTVSQTGLVTSTNYAGSVPADTASASNAVIIGPLPHPTINLADFWFIGTENQKIHLTVVT